MKDLFIAEKPSVAQQFADALGVTARRNNGYIEDDKYVVTWCVGHLVRLSYPEKYDERYKRWSLETLPFLPSEYIYEVIDEVRPQFNIVKGLLNRDDISTIYICTDSGREGEYIYRLVDMMAGVEGKNRKRVWIDSQTKEEILRGIKEAKDWQEYDNLSNAAYLRAKEDYLMGINFSRVLTLRYGSTLSDLLKADRTVLSIGRVMTCVLGMVVQREREIRSFIKTPFYRVVADIMSAEAEWKAASTSEYFESPKLYKENGFRNREDAENLLNKIKNVGELTLVSKEKKKETKNPPLLYNLAEIQNDCSKRFKISPDETLKIIQELYEKKAVTYPRTDARVLSSAVAKEIGKNLSGVSKLAEYRDYTAAILEKGSYKSIGKTRYTNDAQITDHYALIPTGQGLNAIGDESDIHRKVYDLIVRRFLSIFYPSAVFEKIQMDFEVCTDDTHREHLYANFKSCKEKGYLEVIDTKGTDEAETVPKQLMNLKKGDKVNADGISVKEGETSPPKRYTSGSMILAMENAGQLIEDEELRSQIKGSGIGTSATRAEILKKLVSIKYIALNKKTQIITPSVLGEMVYETVKISMKQMLSPEMTASWEKGLTLVADGGVSPEEYMDKLNSFVSGRVSAVMKMNVSETRNYLRAAYNDIKSLV